MGFFQRVQAKAAVVQMQKQPVSTQVAFLNGALAKGLLSESKLHDSLEKSARDSMRKGAEKLAKSATGVTVDLLLKEYYSEAGFKELAARVGLEESWFISLAQAECLRIARGRA